jgi:threonine aldolase
VRRLEEVGLLFYAMDDEVVRFVTSFQTTDADAREAVRRIGQALS